MIDKFEKKRGLGGATLYGQPSIASQYNQCIPRAQHKLYSSNPNTERGVLNLVEKFVLGG